MPSVAQLQQRGHGDGSKPSAVPTSVSREQEFVSNTICTGGFQSRTCAAAAETKTMKKKKAERKKGRKAGRKEERKEAERERERREAGAGMVGSEAAEPKRHPYFLRLLYRSASSQKHGLAVVLLSTSCLFLSLSMLHHKRRNEYLLQHLSSLQHKNNSPPSENPWHPLPLPHPLLCGCMRLLRLAPAASPARPRMQGRRRDASLVSEL